MCNCAADEVLLPAPAAIAAARRETDSLAELLQVGAAAPEEACGGCVIAACA